MKLYLLLPISMLLLSSCIDPMQIEPSNNVIVMPPPPSTDINSIDKTNISTVNPIAITDVNDIEKDKKLLLYKAKMKEVALTIKSDGNYRKVSFDTQAKKEWFRELTFRRWDKQITQDEFMSEALEKYPTHRYEFDFINKGFNRS